MVISSHKCTNAQIISQITSYTKNMWKSASFLLQVSENRFVDLTKASWPLKCSVESVKKLGLLDTISKVIISWGEGIFSHN